MDFSADQRRAIATAVAWFRSPDRRSEIFRIDGPAGSGKTSVACEIVREIGAQATYLAPTNKATILLKAKGCEPVQTLHKALFYVEAGGQGEDEERPPTFISRYDSEGATRPLDDFELIILDECSMVGAKLADELLKYGKPIIALGDQGQLGPVDDQEYFTDQTYVPVDANLDNIHRQESLSSVLAEALSIRAGGQFAGNDVYRGKLMPADVIAVLASADQVICHTNDQRRQLNELIRAHLDLKGDIAIGDKLICKQNDYRNEAFNGTLWRVTELRGTDARLEPFDASADADRQVIMPLRSLRTKRPAFEFGYAITVHAAQGSEWDRVAVVGSPYQMPNRVVRSKANRWWYTAVTRARLSAFAFTWSAR